MSEPLSDERLAEIAKRVTACGACNGIGTAINCSDCLAGELHTRCLEQPGPCGYCGGDGKSGDDEDAVALLAEVRRLREENAVLARKLEATAVSVGGPHVEYAWTTGGSEVDRLHTIIRDLDRKHTGALKERNAARADLARAIELLKRDHWSRRAADCACNTCTFLAEMGKR